MANIVRCETPEKTFRFQPFKVSDYRDFILVRADLKNHDVKKQEEILNDLLDDYFEGHPKTYQQYFFLKVFTSSIAKTKIPIVFTCPVCGKKIEHIFNIYQDALINPKIKLSEETTINLKFPDKLETNISKLLLNNITTVEHKGVKYDWSKLDDETKETLFELITVEQLPDVLKAMKPIYFELKTRKCCDKSSTLVYDDLLSIFKLLINPDEIFSFYEINHILSQNGYDTTSIMNMYPIERTIALSAIEKQKVREKKQSGAKNV